jgi:plastocyanin
MGKGILILIVIIVVAIVGFMVLSPSTPTDESTTTTDTEEYSDDVMMEGDEMEGDSMMEEGKKEGDAMMEGGDAMEKAEPVVIKMTADGFSPITTTIPAGTAVQFINTDTRSHWPASAVHPTHLELSGFDALKAILPGDSYSYTFTKAGEWRMHDHLFPARTGKVIVE